LEISIEANNREGEAKSLMGLGICEEKVFNIFNAMEYMQDALQKARQDQMRFANKFSTELVRVY